MTQQPRALLPKSGPNHGMQATPDSVRFHSRYRAWLSRSVRQQDVRFTCQGVKGGIP
jgi:hypothetical protein